MNPNEYREDCLRPALLKCYNAFECLRKMSFENSFYDNISNFDNFLIEFRSITFTIQKSLGSKDNPIYLKYRDLYLTNSLSGKWMIDNRNIADHEHPFDLGKRLTMHVYSNETADEIFTDDFNVEYDQDFNSILEQISEKLLSYRELEVHFSCTFQFIDNNQKYDIYPYVKDGVACMKRFLNAMYKELNPEDAVTRQLMTKVFDFHFDELPKDTLFVHDYVFNIEQRCFERALYEELVMPDKKLPIKKLRKILTGKNFWESFVALHAKIYMKQDQKILTTFFIFYKDDTVKVKSFQSSIRTTIYRIINNIASEIKHEYVKGIYFVGEMYVYQEMDFDGFMEKIDDYSCSYQDRVDKMSPKTNLAFYRIMEDGSMSVCFLDPLKIEDPQYIKKSIKEGESWNMKTSFLNPLKRAFKEKKCPDFSETPNRE